ncbi:hypothetical protein Syun_003104 [Stephania yunnanensis]|uniref:Nodulation signaling pathway 2-like protein n=1 Tax=Stephania yunnanensis TaxID=152371 RepID=A0AAP0PZJ7_9MAGN
MAMAIAMEEHVLPMATTTAHDLDYFSSGGSTATSDVDCTWNDWSPVVDWDVFSGDHGDFQGLIESMLVDDEEVAPPLDPIEIDEWCNSNSTTTLGTSEGEDEGERRVVVGSSSSSRGGGEDSKGLRLVHLLMAAAEALTGPTVNRELARVILVRLKELVSPTDGTNMERLAAYFTQALHNLLEGAGAAGGGAHNSYNNNSNNKKHNNVHFHGPHEDDVNPTTHHHQSLHRTDVIAAFQLLQDMSPYVKFGHFTSNQAILEVVAHDRRVHILDYDIMEGVQWASLIQSLASRKEGPSAPHLRITALSRSGGPRKSIATVQETGRRLSAFAASIGQPFSFHQCRVDSDESFRPSSLKLVKGEALVVNCMLHIPHHSCSRGLGSVSSFLMGAQELGPRLVTLVEEEVGRTRESGFVGRFMDSLHHYSAVCDSLEAGFPMQSRARGLVEKVFLGPRIAKTVASMYRSQRGEEANGWAEWLNRVGFEPVSLSFANHCQARLLVGLFNDGYRVEEMGCNKIVLGWKSRRIISASVWAPVGPTDSDLTS